MFGPSCSTISGLQQHGAPQIFMIFSRCTLGRYWFLPAILMHNRKCFYDKVPVGGRLIVFGAVHTNTQDPMAAPDVLEPEHEPTTIAVGGTIHGTLWRKADRRKLETGLLRISRAYKPWFSMPMRMGYGFVFTHSMELRPRSLSCHGWFPSYNFGSLARAKAAVARSLSCEGRLSGERRIRTCVELSKTSAGQWCDLFQVGQTGGILLDPMVAEQVVRGTKLNRPEVDDSSNANRRGTIRRWRIGGSAIYLRGESGSFLKMKVRRGTTWQQR